MEKVCMCRRGAWSIVDKYTVRDDYEQAMSHAPLRDGESGQQVEVGG